MQTKTLISVCLGLVLAAAPDAQQARDGRIPRTPGTATISGTVTPDDDPSKPIRGAVVTLNDVDKAYADTTITDERGQFSFRQVPAGRYSIAGAKPGYLTVRYGATRPARAGVPIAIADGEQRAGLRVLLARGAVLTGTVRLANGEPAQGAEVRVQRVITGSTGRRYVDVYEDAEDDADDQGVFRLYGLAEGDYIVHVVPQRHFMEGAVLPTRSVDVQWARAQLRAATAEAAGPPASRPLLSPVPVYYPGVLERSAAGFIRLSRGETRSGVDVTLQIVPSYRVTGTILSPAGALTRVPQVFLIEGRGDGMDRTSSINFAEGTNFTMTGVTPGTYTLMASVREDKLFAISEVRVSGQDVQVSLPLQPALRMSGRVVFDGTAKPPAFEELGLQLLAAGTGVMLTPTPAVISADGSFTIDGLVPGHYHFAGIGARVPQWSIRSAKIGAQDLSVTPVDLTTALINQPIVVTLTDRSTELSGRLQDSQGRAAADFFIIVFSANERAWYARSRAVVQTRPASDGQFSFRGLPPGDYYLAAVTDVEREEWFDPGFLRDLMPSAIRISVAEGQQTRQDVRVGKD